MLTLTDSASDAIRQLGARPELPSGSGIRIDFPADGSDVLAVAPSTTPMTNDEVVESHGARVFLDRAVANLLDDMVLDVRVDTDGRVWFLLRSSLG